jgi:uncharacterized protein (TIGR02996 family)
MSMVDQFLDDLSRNPDDWRLRGVFADWCEDNNELDRADCLRWMVRHKKRPHPGAYGRATWYDADTITVELDPESNIPGAIFELLEGGRAVARHQSFPAVRDAEEAFYAAWEKARKRGWNPET